MAQIEFWGLNRRRTRWRGPGLSVMRLQRTPPGSAEDVTELALRVSVLRIWGLTFA